MIRNQLRVRKHLNSQTDQHVVRVVLRRGQRTEAKHKDRSAKHVFKIDPASTEFHPISAAQRIQESPTQPGCHSQGEVAGPMCYANV